MNEFILIVRGKETWTFLNPAEAHECRADMEKQGIPAAVYPMSAWRVMKRVDEALNRPRFKAQERKVN